MPKLSQYQKKGEPSLLEQVKTESSREKSAGDSTCHRNAHDAALHCDGDLPEPAVNLVYGKGQPGAAAIPEGSVEREDIRGYGNGLSEETFFRFLDQSPESRITQIIQEQQENMPEVCENLLAS